MQPESADLQINAKWLIPVIPANTTFADCSVVVRDGRIVAVSPRAEATRRFQCRETLELPHHLLIPGLVNAHGHAAMSLLRGIADDYDLNTWLSDYIWPMEARWVCEDFVRDGTDLALAEMIRGGTTCFADQYFFPEQIAAASHDAGIRGQVGFPILDFATAWAKDGDACIHKGLQLHDNYRNHDLIRIAFAPHSTYTVAESLFERIAVYANELDNRVHIHVQETAEEVTNALRDRGERPLQTLHRLGLLTANTQCVHMVALNEEDMDLVADTRAHVVHCPKSNLKLGSGISPVAELLDKGINVALGTDGAASNNSLDMLSEMQFAALLAKGINRDPTVLGTHQVLRMATINGARALGMEDIIGSVEVGKSADLVAIDLSGLGQQPLHNPASQLCYTNISQQVSHSWVAGKALLDGGELTTLNEKDLRDKCQQWHSRIGAGQ